MKKLFSIFIILFANTVFANVPDIVAIVNDQPITKYDFETRKKLLAVLNNVDMSNPNINRSLNGATINMLIEEELLMQYANEVGMKISEDRIKHALSTIEQQNNMPSGAMTAHLLNNGVKVESFKKQITGELIKYNIINSLTNSVSVSPSEIDVAIINTFNTDFIIQAWIFTAKEHGNDAYKQMQVLRKNVSPENLDKLKTFLTNKKMSQKASKFFKNLKTKANIKIMLSN